MSLHTLQPGQRLDVSRGDVVICIPVHGALDKLAECLSSVSAHTPANVAVVVLDDGSPDPNTQRLVADIAEAHPGSAFHYCHQAEQVGFVGTANAAFEITSPADVVLLNSDCVVTPGWLDALRAAVAVDTRIASASAISNSATILSLPHRNRPAPNLPHEWSLDQAAKAIKSASLRLRPRIPTALGHCVLIRRSALDLVGGFDTVFAPGYEEEVDFSQRCLVRGMFHVAADDCFVLHYGGSSFGNNRGAKALQDAHHKIVAARYPYYDPWVSEVAEDESGPLARALGATRRALLGLSVTIDGRILTPVMTGTQLHVLEVITALDALGDVSLRVVVPPDLGDYAAERLAGLPMVTLHQAGKPVHTVTDVVHRPFQLTEASDLVLLRSWGHRLVVTHQDLIAYENPAYFSNYEAWRTYRRVTRQALTVADRVLFFSNHAAQEAITAELVDDARAEVVYIGTDHQLAGITRETQEPLGADKIGNRPFLLCLGTDFKHKNRVFAMRVVEALHERHAWDGVLVLAGPRVACGSSSGDEAAFLGTRPALRDRIVELASVDEGAKSWLLERASGVIYPTVIEGFGLLPFEAARSGLPCFFAHESSLAELFPKSAATLVPWDAEASADAVMPLLQNGPERDVHVHLLRATSAEFTWTQTAHGLLRTYRTAAQQPAREAASVAREQAMLDARREWLESELKHTVSEAKRAQSHERELIERVREKSTALTPLEYDTARRALATDDDAFDYELRLILLAVAYRRWLRRLVFGPMRLAYRMGYVLRNRRRPRNRTQVSP